MRKTTIKIDLHVHTKASKDSFIDLKDAIKTAKNIGLDGLAITDHDTIEAAVIAANMKTDIIIIPGIEVSAKEGHILGIGITEEIPRGLTAKETVEKIRELGGISIVPHPFDFFRHGIGENVVRKISPDAIESINSNSVFFYYAKRLSEKLAEEIQKPQTAGSDAHLLSSIGKAYTAIETTSTDIESILESIKMGRTKPVGKPTSIRTKINRHLRFALRRMKRGPSNI